MKKTRVSNPRIDQDMASEYRFDFSKAKPNRFAEKMNLNVGRTMEIFAVDERKESSLKAQDASGKKKVIPKKKVVKK